MKKIISVAICIIITMMLAACVKPNLTATTSEQQNEENLQNNGEYLEKNTVSEDDIYEKIRNAKKYDEIVFGKYDGIPVEWYVISNEDGDVKLLSKYIIDETVFVESDNLLSLINLPYYKGEHDLDIIVRLPSIDDLSDLDRSVICGYLINNREFEHLISLESNVYQREYVEYGPDFDLITGEYITFSEEDCDDYLGTCGYLLSDLITEGWVHAVWPGGYCPLELGMDIKFYYDGFRPLVEINTNESED